MMNIGKKEGTLEEEEHGLLHRAFEFTDLTLREIMTPRTAIIALPKDTSIENLITAFREHGFSRLPVYDGNIDEIRGMIHYKDLLFSLENGSATDIAHLIRPVLYVPDSQMTSELLAVMERGQPESSDSHRRVRRNRRTCYAGRCCRCGIRRYS